MMIFFFFFFSSRRRHTRFDCDWSSDVCSSDLKLNVRRVNRSTRRVVVTEVGHEVYRHASAMLAEADAAVEAVEFARAKPCGTIKASCPVALAQSSLAPILPQFLEKYPAIRLELQVSNRRVDVLAEGLDVALRVRSEEHTSELQSQSNLVCRLLLEKKKNT